MHHGTYMLTHELNTRWGIQAGLFSLKLPLELAMQDGRGVREFSSLAKNLLAGDGFWGRLKVILIWAITPGGLFTLL